MTNRERWIVYPLLFYAVLSCMMSELVVPTDASYETVNCKQLAVESVDGRPLIQLGAVIKNDGSEAGLVEVLGAPGSGVPLAIELGANASGGYVKSFGPASAPILMMGHDREREQSGFYAEDKGQLITHPERPTEPWGSVLAFPASEPTDSEVDSGGGSGPAEADTESI